MKRIGIVRVSTKGQEVDQQVTELRNYDSSIEVLKFIGVHGDEMFGHPKFKALLKRLEVEDEEVEVVVTWLDRWGRDPEDAINGIKIISGFGACFTSLKEHVFMARTDNEVGMLTVRILAAVAGFERARIQERTRMSLQELKRQGVPLGPSPKLTTADCNWIIERHTKDGWGYQRITKALLEHRNRTVSKSTVVRALGKGKKPYVPLDAKQYKGRAS